MVNMAFLRIPLMMLDDIGDIENFQGLGPENVSNFHKEYTPQEVGDILESMKLATSQPEFDFTPFMPSDVGYSNAQVHTFLSKIYASLC